MYVVVVYEGPKSPRLPFPIAYESESEAARDAARHARDLNHGGRVTLWRCDAATHMRDCVATWNERGERF